MGHTGSRLTLFALFFLFFFCFAISADSEVKDETFSIQPYFFLMAGKNNPRSASLVLQWRYDEAYEPPAKIGVVVRKDGKKVFALEAKEHDGLQRVVFPAESALDKHGPNLTFHLRGLKGDKKLPRPGNKKEFSFWLISDLHLKEGIRSVHREMASRMLRSPADFILLTGDVSDEETPQTKEAWPEFLGVMAPVLKSSVLVASAGNHDYKLSHDADDVWKRYLATPLTETYYYADVGPTRIVVLNSNFEADDTLLEKQRAWLKELTKVRGPRKWIVLFHHSPISGQYRDKTLKVIKGLKPDSIKIRDELLPILKEAGITLLALSGDVHWHQRVVTGCGTFIAEGPTGGVPKAFERIEGLEHEGTQFRMAGTSMTRFTVRADGVSGDTRDRYGNLHDSFTVPTFGNR